MFWTNTKRVIRSGFVNFWRNGYITFAAILVMVITLFVVGSLIFLNAMLGASLNQIRDKVDVNVYFVEKAQEEDILALQKQLEERPEVVAVEYISRDEALARFRERHDSDAIALQALDELGDNPLRASLRVKANDPSQYEQLSSFLENDVDVLTSDGIPIIAKVNFNDNRAAIERLTAFIEAMESFGLALTISLVVASVIIIFNTIRLAIYTAREEIAVMRLVGASNSYIRGPFVFEGVMYGFISGVITLLIFYPATLYLGESTESFFGNINIFSYYTQNFGTIFLMILGSGIMLGALSSFLAVKKYLRL